MSGAEAVESDVGQGLDNDLESNKGQYGCSSTEEIESERIKEENGLECMPGYLHWEDDLEMLSLFKDKKVLGI